MEEVDNSFHNLCRIGNLDGVMEYIDNGFDINERDDDERIGLHWAASSKNTELVQYLLSLNGIQVNCQDDAGTTPLMCAVSAGRIDNVVLLLDAGADVNLENENKETVLHMTRNHTDILRLFVDQIADINKKNDYGLTALMKAASLGCLDSITVLLDHGADMYACDMEGNTAAHYAAFDNQREAYLLLKRRGFDENTVNNENKTPLDYVHFLIC